MDGLDPAHVPLGVPPSGQLSNLINAQSRAWIPRLAVYTTLPVSLCFVIMRLFTRIRMRHIVGWDDCMVTPWPGNAAFILTSKDLCILSAVGYPVFALHSLLLESSRLGALWR